MNDSLAYYITWTTYGTWLPGDLRGWRKTGRGAQLPQPRLEAWCRRRLKGTPLRLSNVQRQKVADACREHAKHRNWIVHAINPRTTHMHIALEADRKPQTVRDQLKANATRVLRQDPDPLRVPKTWSRGGDCEVLDSKADLDQVVKYINDAQDWDAPFAE